MKNDKNCVCLVLGALGASCPCVLWHDSEVAQVEQVLLWGSGQSYSSKRHKTLISVSQAHLALVVALLHTTACVL